MNEVKIVNCGLENMTQRMNTNLDAMADYYNLINPNEIWNFISNIEGMLELINILAELIKKYFPNANTYLAFEEDFDEDADCIYAYILNEELSYEENDELSELCFKEYRKFRNKYHEAWLRLNFDIQYDEEYFINCQKAPEIYNKHI